MNSMASVNRAKFAIKSYSVEHGYPSRRRSLVGDAQFETVKNREAKLYWLQESRSASQDNELSEEEVIVVNESAKDDALVPKESNLLINLKDGRFGGLAKIIRIIEACKGNIDHLESRKSMETQNNLDLFVKLEISSSGLLHVIKSMRQNNLAEVTLLREKHISVKDPWFPRHISELDFCTHIIAKYEPELDSDHPGFLDKTYRQRRKEMAEIAFNYKYGQPIPRVIYTAKEIITWGEVYKELVRLFETHACRTHIQVFRLLEKECGYAANNIPQLEDISLFLKKRTGFILRPAAGLLTARDFLASLAFRVFQTTQYLRHESNPHHSPEPDCIHELIGHVPILADPVFAQFSQEIGLASLGASDEEIEKFATLYWFTVEFGLCKENGEIKAYGAGLLSSYGELQHSLSDKPELRPFEPEKTAIQSYQDVDYQDIYYVAESFDDAKDKFRQYVATKLKRRYEIYYDSFTDSVHILDSVEKLERFANKIKSDMNCLSNGLTRMNPRN